MTVLRIRLLREAQPPRSDGSPVRFGLQDKGGAMHGGIAREDGLVQFDFEVTERAHPATGSPISAGHSSADREAKGLSICPGSASTALAS